MGNSEYQPWETVNIELDSMSNFLELKLDQSFNTHTNLSLGTFGARSFSTVDNSTIPARASFTPRSVVPGLSALNEGSLVNTLTVG